MFSQRRKIVNEHIQRSAKRAKAEAFAQLLADQNPHILAFIIQPYNDRFREVAKSDDELFMAMNIIMEFVMKLESFPTAPEHVARNVASRLNFDGDYLCKSEVEIAANLNDKTIEEWGNQVVTSELLSSLTILDNDDMIVAIRDVLWGIFSCLRQAPRN